MRTVFVFSSNDSFMMLVFVQVWLHSEAVLHRLSAKYSWKSFTDEGFSQTFPFNK